MDGLLRLCFLLYQRLRFVQRDGKRVGTLGNADERPFVADIWTELTFADYHLLAV